MTHFFLVVLAQSQEEEILALLSTRFDYLRNKCDTWV